MEFLNPEIDFAALAATWQVDQRLRIDAVLRAELATQLVLELEQLSFDYLFFSAGQNRIASRQAMSELSIDQRKSLQDELHGQAAKGMGFFYGGYRMQDDNLQNAPPALRTLFTGLNSAEFRTVIESITNVMPIEQASGQFTKFEPGHYLTRHSDKIALENRKIAYVVNLSPNWHPDWGGLLQFYEDNGASRDAWSPNFNSLSLFDVRHIHAVTYITPYAAAPRYALSGWFR